MKKTKRAKLKAWANEHRDGLVIASLYIGFFTIIGGPIVYSVMKDEKRKNAEVERWKYGYVMHNNLEECDGIFVAPALPPK